MESIKRISQLTASPARTKRSTSLLLLWRIISVGAVIHLIVFDLLILNAPESLQVQFAPDDGYYYLTLARNFVRFSQWTFDGGISVTSGFHLAYAYILAGFYKFLQPTQAVFVQLGMGFGIFITVIVVCIAWWVCIQKNDSLFLIVFTILVTAKPFLFNSVSMTEWPLVILVAGLYCLYFYRRETAVRGHWGLFTLGLLGSLVRSDFGLLPFGLLISALLLERDSQKKPLTGEAFAGVLGAILGVAIVFVHTFATTGAWFQSSALMKGYWASFVHQKLYNTIALILKVIGLDLSLMDFDRSTLLLGVLLISGPLILIFLAKRHGQNQLSISGIKPPVDRPLRERALVFGAAISLAGYSIFYAHNGAIQHWYTGNLTWPLFILLTAGARYIDRRILKEHQFTAIWLSVFLLTSLGLQIPSLYPLSAQTAPWPHQQVMLQASRYLSQYPLDGYIGSWNSGVAGYYSEGTDIINIDGLVNNDIYPYAITNTLPTYLRAKEIHYILDFENMFHPPFPRRGGYEDRMFLAQLEPLKTFDQGQFAEFKYLRLYRIKQ
ncbi:MAG TPA: hypothetical protein VK900_00425 [Anaerolineales bacterium]|nr:hypothetical protein [Anaerolineales bacterium]